MTKSKIKPVTEWRIRDDVDGGYYYRSFVTADDAGFVKSRMIEPHRWSVIRVEIRPVEKKKGKVK